MFGIEFIIPTYIIHINIKKNKSLKKLIINILYKSSSNSNV